MWLKKPAMNTFGLPLKTLLKLRKISDQATFLQHIRTLKAVDRGLHDLSKNFGVYLQTRVQQDNYATDAQVPIELGITLDDWVKVNLDYQRYCFEHDKEEFTRIMGFSPDDLEPDQDVHFEMDPTKTHMADYYGLIANLDSFSALMERCLHSGLEQTICYSPTFLGAGSEDNPESQLNLDTKIFLAVILYSPENTPIASHVHRMKQGHDFVSQALSEFDNE